MDDLDLLVSLLTHLDQLPDVEKHLDEEGYFQQSGTDNTEYDALYDKIQAYADAALITANGQAKFSAHRKLEAQSSYRVVCGEKDSFGWLTGVIITSKGRIVYG